MAGCSLISWTPWLLQVAQISDRELPGSSLTSQATSVRHPHLSVSQACPQTPSVSQSTMHAAWCLRWLLFEQAHASNFVYVIRLMLAQGR